MPFEERNDEYEKFDAARGEGFERSWCVDCRYSRAGGIEGWKAAGLGVAADRSKPVEIMRQVQIAAGSLVVLGVLLGFVIHTGFFLLSAFVGAGLVFAGVSGTCAMAKLLGFMPWNRPATS